MSTTKIAISIDNEYLKKIDFYVKKHVFKSRSQAFQISINHVLKKLEHKRLAKECAKLDPKTEQAMADTGLDEDLASGSK